MILLFLALFCLYVCAFVAGLSVCVEATYIFSIYISNVILRGCPPFLEEYFVEDFLCFARISPLPTFLDFEMLFWGGDARNF